MVRESRSSLLNFWLASVLGKPAACLLDSLPALENMNFVLPEEAFAEAGEIILGSTRVFW